MNKFLEATNFAKLDNTKVRTNAVRLSFAHVWEPSAANGSDEKKYSTSILIRKNDVKTVKAIEKAIESAKEAGKSSKFGGKIPGNLKLPLRDGDDERGDEDAYKNMFFLNASSKIQPGILKAENGYQVKVEDESEVYSGCWVIAALNFFPYNSNGSKGIAVGLNNILKVADDDNLGGRASAEADFGDLDLDLGLDIDDDDLF